MIIWTPDHPYFQAVLLRAPQWLKMFKEKAEPGYFIADEFGVLHHKSRQQLIDYALDGELEEQHGSGEEVDA